MSVSIQVVSLIKGETNLARAKGFRQFTVSIQVVSLIKGERLESNIRQAGDKEFVSIQVVSLIKGERFLYHHAQYRILLVSIQVVSLIKGEVKLCKVLNLVTNVSIQVVSLIKGENGQNGKS